MVISLLLVLLMMLRLLSAPLLLHHHSARVEGIILVVALETVRAVEHPPLAGNFSQEELQSTSALPFLR